MKKEKRSIRQTSREESPGKSYLIYKIFSFLGFIVRLFKVKAGEKRK